jgi:hypothetical protein
MQIKQKKVKRQYPKSSAPYVRRSESDMLKIVHEIQSNLISKRSACFKYGLNRNTLKLFIDKYSISNLDVKFPNIDYLPMSDNKKDNAQNRKIRELEKHLEYAKLKIISLETLIKVAEEDLHIKIRKKPGTKQLKE